MRDQIRDYDETDQYDDVDDWQTPDPHTEPFTRYLPGVGVVTDGQYGGAR